MAIEKVTLISATVTQGELPVADEDEYAEARDGMLADIARGYDLGTKGKITWTRDSMHER